MANPPSFTSLVEFDEDRKAVVSKSVHIRSDAMDADQSNSDNSQQTPAKDAQKKDASLEDAVNAAEKAMRAMKLAPDPAERARLSKQVKQLLTDAENIKYKQDARSVTPKAVFPASKTASSNFPIRRLPKVPLSTRPLSKGEQILLLKSSFLHGFKFPPWTVPPEPSEFALRDGEELFLYVSFVFPFFPFSFPTDWVCHEVIQKNYP